MLSRDQLVRCGWTLAGSAILAFGLYHIHSFSGVTEGGVLGATLLLDHWFGISPAVSGLVLNGLCYLLGWRLMGNGFLAYSAVACGGFSAVYAVVERFPPLWPEIGRYPFAAAVLGAVFVGVGAGLGVRCGGASGGDDALAMSACRLTGCKVEQAYLVTDLTVLLLSLSYIPPQRIIWSLITVLISGRLVGWIQRMPSRILPPAL